jgi:quercetin 2,3-dioxygenase
MSAHVRSNDGWEKLPGRPEPYVLREGQGERSLVLDSLATVVVSGDETGGQFGIQIMQGVRGPAIPAHVHPNAHHTIWVLDGEVRVWAEDESGKRLATLLAPGDLLFLPAGTTHTYAVESATARIAGINTGDFERFVHPMGEPTTALTPPTTPLPPDPASLQAANQEFGIVMRPDWDFRSFDAT